MKDKSYCETNLEKLHQYLEFIIFMPYIISAMVFNFGGVDFRFFFVKFKGFINFFWKGPKKQGLENRRKSNLIVFFSRNFTLNFLFSKFHPSIKVKNLIQFTNHIDSLITNL